MFIFGSKTSKIANAVKKGKGAPLVALLNDKDEAIRLAAIDGLGEIRSGENLNPLINLLQDASAAVRAHSASAMAKIGDVHAKEHLARAIGNEKDAAARAAMQNAINALKDF